jgi:hypothetical protein
MDTETANVFGTCYLCSPCGGYRERQRLTKLSLLARRMAWFRRNEMSRSFVWPFTCTLNQVVRLAMVCAANGVRGIG